MSISNYLVYRSKYIPICLTSHFAHSRWEYSSFLVESLAEQKISIRMEERKEQGQPREETIQFPTKYSLLGESYREEL